MKQISNQYYLESAPMTKSVAHLSIPMMIGVSLSTIYNVINIFFIGLLHNTQMVTAITLALPISTILMAFGNMFGVGGGTFITRLVAKGKIEEAKHIAGYISYSSIITAILIAVIALLTITPIVNILGADISTMNYTKNYTLTMFLGGFSIILNFALEQIVRSEGASKESMNGMIISTVLNFIFDPIFILIIRLNVVGVALSTILANIASCIYYIYYLETKSEHLRKFIYCFRISLKDKMEIYKIGISRLLMSAFLIITTLLLNNFSIEYGDNVVAGFGIALRITQVPEFLSMGLYLGIIPLIAYNFSNKNFVRLRSGIRQSALFIGILSIVFGALVYIFKLPIIGLFSNDSSVISIGAYIMAAMLISTLFNGFTGLFTGVFQASGQGIPTAIMSVTQGTLYIPVIIILHNLFGLHGVIWSMTVTEVITCIIGFILYTIFNYRIKKLEINSL
ncbi:MATE family efflux transporter [Clostridium sp. WILCCON 0269]|uniref:Multidrug export protein MepA n=1 Tax=Candidatus Clostridium eludens TaxID=3381663 RepID=A0ABW8SQI4_9CLOT